MTDGHEESHPADVIDIGSLDLSQDFNIIERKGRRVEDTRAQLAYMLLALLAGVLLILLVMLFFHRLSPADFANVMGILLAPLVGLVAAATGYYYGRAER